MNLTLLHTPSLAGGSDPRGPGGHPRGDTEIDAGVLLSLARREQLLDRFLGPSLKLSKGLIHLDPKGCCRVCFPLLSPLALGPLALGIRLLSFAHWLDQEEPETEV